MALDFLIFSMDKRDFIDEIQFVLVEIVIALIIIGLLTFVIIRAIARSFSNPIQNTVVILKRLAEGDLAAESNDFLADERCVYHSTTIIHVFIFYLHTIYFQKKEDTVLMQNLLQIP
ncbi:MAG TPA: hypothetical protein PLV81_12640 [Spirochaetota bacterium]|nr:hypothetical protein [Spirochaetota bacterium]